MANFIPCLAFTLQAEGGYQADRNDAGNWSTGVINAGELIGTNWGISAPTLVAWLGPEGRDKCTSLTMQTLTQHTAESIYGAHYWLPVCGPKLPAGIDLMVFDHGVNAGPRASARLLQQALGCLVDGYIGPQTLSVVAAAAQPDLIDFLGRLQLGAYQRMPGAAHFLEGWGHRLEGRIRAAHHLQEESMT